MERWGRVENKSLFWLIKLNGPVLLNMLNLSVFLARDLVHFILTVLLGGNFSY